MRFNNMTDRKGFTLIELLLTASLVLTLAVTLSTSLLQGYGVYQRLLGVRAYEDVAFFLERLNRDLKSSADYEPIPFVTQPDGIAFCTLVNESETLSGLGAVPKRVRYIFDHNRQLVRRTVSASFESKIPLTDRGTVVLEHVRDFEFKRFPEGNALPKKIQVSFNYGEGPNAKRIFREVILPYAWNR